MHSDSHLYSGHVHAVSTAFHGNCNLRERAVEGNDALRNSHLYANHHVVPNKAMQFWQWHMMILANHLPASQKNKQRQEVQNEDKTSHN